MPDEVSELITLFGSIGYTLSFELIDPMHNTELETPIIQTSEYMENVKIQICTFEEYLQTNIFQNDFILFDFTGKIYPNEIYTEYQLETEYNHIVYPFGCLAKSFNYVEFLKPICKITVGLFQQSNIWNLFYDIDINSYLNEFLHELNQNADKFYSTDIADKMTNDYSTNMILFTPLFATMIKEYHIEQKIQSNNSYCELLINSYENKETSIEYKLHQTYMNTLLKKVIKDIKNCCVILNGFHTYDKILPWYMQQLSALNNANLLIEVYSGAILYFINQNRLFKNLSSDDIICNIVTVRSISYDYITNNLIKCLFDDTV